MTEHHTDHGNDVTAGRRTFLKATAGLGTLAVGLATAGSATARQATEVKLQNFDPSKSTVEIDVPDLDLSSVDPSLVSVKMKNVHVNNIRILSHNHHVIWIDMKHSDVEDVTVLSADATVTLDGVEFGGSDEMEI